MKISIPRWLFSLIILFSPLLQADDTNAAMEVYSQIKDIYNPTLDDYRLIQNYLSSGERSVIHRLNDYYPNARNFKIIGSTPEEMPRAGRVVVNCSEEDRENCLICYSSFNKNYPRGLTRLVDVVSKSDFKGHILYRLGGWPNVEGGSLVLAHVPYAFKISSFKEAQRLGYKRAFWLDTSVLPYISLNEIFAMIEEKGYFVMGNCHNIGPYNHSAAAAYFGLTLEETHNIPSCSAGIFGVDFTNPIGLQIVDAWHAAAFDKDAFYSPRSDQNALSTCLYLLGISDFINISRLAKNRSQITSDTVLLIEREFVNELSL